MAPPGQTGNGGGHQSGEGSSKPFKSKKSNQVGSEEKRKSVVPDFERSQNNRSQADHAAGTAEKPKKKKKIKTTGEGGKVKKSKKDGTDGGKDKDADHYHHRLASGVKPHQNEDIEHVTKEDSKNKGNKSDLYNNNRGGEKLNDKDKLLLIS